MGLFKQLGGRINKSERQKLSRSEHWNGKKFENLEATSMDINPRTLPGLLKKQFTNTNGRIPKRLLPIVPFDQVAWEKPSATAKFIWYGHSVILLQVDGKNILFDPMFGEDASPIGPIRTKRFSEGTLAILQQLPELDVVLMSHDHYDHLDLASYEILKSKTKQFIVPLGLGRHLEAWGINAGQIQEMDWWERTTIDDIKIDFTPSRHFTGRGLMDRSKSLWGGYVLKSKNQNIYISGDGGYGQHFKTIGEKYGPFDFAFIECGQYNDAWRQIHLHPEESVQAAIDAKAKLAMPIHWGAFKLAMHNWEEPVERFTAEAENKKFAWCTPRMGEIVEINGNYPREKWWDTP